LILFSWKSAGTAVGHIPLRYYEFLSTDNPIIAMQDSNNSFEPGNHLTSFSKASDIDEVVKFLEKLYESDSESTSDNITVNFDLTYASRAKALAKFLTDLHIE
jgi:hypothetical protein